MNEQKFTSDLRKLQGLLRAIPSGRVTTYGRLAELMGRKRAARYIGKLLNRNPDPDIYPCFKVVMSDGRLGGYALGGREKVKRLSREGIKVKNGRLDNFAKIIY